MTERPVYVYFFVGKNYRGILENNDYNSKINDFVALANAKIGRQWVLKEIGTIFEIAYWLCGSLSHDFRKGDSYEFVVDSLSEHTYAWYRGLPEYPEAMDTLHAVVYLILKHDAHCKRIEDAYAAISCIKNKTMAEETAIFAMEDKEKYEYDYSISIDRNWRDCEIKSRMKGWYMDPEAVAERIVSFASYFDEDDKEGMVNRAFSEAINVAQEEGCVSWFKEYSNMDEYEEAVRTNLLERLDAGELEKNNRYCDNTPQTEVDRKRNHPQRETDHSSEDIIQYVMKLHPFYVSEKWKEHYRSLWEKVLQIPEVEAVIYDKGQQKNTTFNRNLVGNILHLMAYNNVLCGDNATRLTIALEGDKNASVRAQLGMSPKDKKQERSIIGIIETFLP